MLYLGGDGRPAEVEIDPLIQQAGLLQIFLYVHPVVSSLYDLFTIMFSRFAGEHSDLLPQPSEQFFPIRVIQVGKPEGGEEAFACIRR